MQNLNVCKYIRKNKIQKAKRSKKKTKINEKKKIKQK